MMKLRIVLAAGLCSLSQTAHAAGDNALTPAPSEKASPGNAIPNRYIVEVKAGVNPQAVAPAHGIVPDFIYRRAVNGFAGQVAPGRLAALAADPRVTRVVPDRAVSAIGKPSSGGGTNGQVTPAGVTRIGAAPGFLSFTGAGVGVAVVDTGVDYNHADLKPLGAASFSAFGGSAQDNNGHGTHVSGTIAARNNNLDVVGVASGATIYGVKVLDANGSGSDAGVTAGLEWVAANAALVSPPIRVVNMSLGRTGTINDNPIQHAAIQNLVANGITVVVAAGNDASLEVSEQVPSTYPEVIAVASTTAVAGTNAYRGFSGVIGADTASYFTSDGAWNNTTGIGVSISAPGETQENISKAAFIQSVGILSTKLGGGTTSMSGTSMASPHTAGVAALICQQAQSLGQTWSPEQIRTKIRNGASNFAAPLDSPTSSYSFDGVREGVLYAPGALRP
jgi:subtilisin family serine protease